MEIYQEPALDPSATTTPGRKQRAVGVSFAQGFTKTPVQPRSGRKPLGMHNYQGTPHSNKAKSNSMANTKSTGSSTFQPSKTPTQSRPKTLDKENNGAEIQGFFTASLSPPLTATSSRTSSSQKTITPGSAQAFRRTLRGQSAEYSGTSLQKKRQSDTNRLGPPLRMAPKTPTSLLRTELESDVDEDESFLVSPSGFSANFLAVNRRTPSTAGNVVATTQSHETSGEISHIETNKGQDKAWASPTPQWSEGDTVPKLATSVNLSSPPLKVTRSGVAIDLSSMFSTEKQKRSSLLSRNENRKTPPADQRLVTQAQITAIPEKQPEAIGFWSIPAEPEPEQVTHQVAKKIVANESKEKNQGKGVAMDMSDMFVSRSPENSKNSSPPPNLLKRLQRSTSKKQGTSGIPASEAGSVRPTASNTTRQQKGTTKKHVPLSNDENSSLPKSRNVEVKAESDSSKKGLKPLLSRSSLRNAKPALGQPSRRKLGERSSQSVSRPVTFQGSLPAIQPQTAENVAPNEQRNVLTSTKKYGPAKLSMKKTSGQRALSPRKVPQAPTEWADKQCETFQHWLNYTFHPMEDDDSVNPSSSRSGLRALVIHRHLAQVRFRAAELFQSDGMRRARTTVQTEIAKGKLTIRSDRDVHADLNLRKLAVKLLLSYTTPWLRLGLEVMFGECIMPDDLQETEEGQVTPVARMRATLKSFVLDRVLSDHTVLIKYTKGRTKVPSGKFEKLYREEMRTLVLYRMMVLILFLDRAKMANVLETAPRLFTKSADVKSSKAVLLSFCRNFLSAEGDFIKHLSRIGIKVSYTQDPIDELEFKVENLAADLRSGSRLTRLAEIVGGTEFKSVMKSLRLPAVSRLQKLHNVNAAFLELKRHGVFIPRDINAHHIVDAHREMVLKLMWSVVAHMCLSKLLSGGQVEEEIQSVLQSNRARRKVQGQIASALELLSPTKPEEDAASPSEQELKTLLFRWCQAVCSNYDLELSDFTSSFADGRALCYLVHYYHPGIIKSHEILPTEADDSLSEEQALRNQRSNSLLVARRISDLGGIPRMLPIMDTTNPPDEKSMLLCLTYLCSRLMESSKEIFATILIQAYYRRYKDRVLLRKKQEAAATIFKIWSENKHRYYAALECRYVASVRVLEDFVLSHRHALRRLKQARLHREGRNDAALNIQRCFRGYLGRCHFWDEFERHESAILIQKSFRRFRAQTKFFEDIVLRECATLIQSKWRSYAAREAFKGTTEAACILQRCFRGALVRQTLYTQHIAAMTIQKAWWTWVDVADSHLAATIVQARWRGVVCRTQFNERRRHVNAAVSIQKIWRGKQQIKSFNWLKHNVVLIQCTFRGFQLRKVNSLKLKRRAAIEIQKMARGFSAQVQYQMDYMDIVTVQSLFRRRKAMGEMLARIDAIEVLQSAVRCALARRKCLKLLQQKDFEVQQESAAVLCQSFVRVWRARRTVQTLRQENRASISIQAVWRQYQCQREFRRQVRAAITIQATVRCTLETKRLRQTISKVLLIQASVLDFLHRKLQIRSAILIQSSWRKVVAQRTYQWQRDGVCCIQKHFRGYRAREEIRITTKSAVQIQKLWRSFWARYNYELDVLEVVLCQSVVRRLLARRELANRRQAVQVIQSFCRCRKAVRVVSNLRESRADFIQRTQAATAIQALARGRIALISRSIRESSVLSLQSFARMVLCSSRLRQQKVSAICIQRLFRGHSARMLQLKHASMATLIQSAWRGFTAMVDFGVQRYAATQIQGCSRMFLARALFCRQRSAAIKIQACIRREQALVLAYEEYAAQVRANEEFRAASTIQALFRQTRDRTLFLEMKWSTTRIQAIFRGHQMRIAFEMEMFDVLLCQSVCRRWLACREMSGKQNAAIAIQACFRRAKAARALSSLKLAKQRCELEYFSASKLQGAYRGHLVRRNMRALSHYATRIQSLFRGHFSYVCYQILRADITIIQTAARRWLAQRHFSRKHRSLLMIQAFARKVIAGNRVDALRNIKRQNRLETKCATMIQSTWLRYKAVCKVQRLGAARQIQKTWRCFAAHVDYLVKQIMVIRLQARVRTFLSRNSFVKVKSGVTRLQAVHRGIQQRFHVEMAKMAATVIQSAFRRIIYRSSFIQKKNAAVTVQRLIRGHLVRDELELSHFAATEIQRVWRGYVGFCDYVITLDSTIKIQSIFRMKKAVDVYGRQKLLQHVEKCFEEKTAVKIQRAYRTHRRQQLVAKAAFTIQKCARAYLNLRRKTVVSRGVTRLQATFRARKVRRRRTKKVSILARRVKMANVKARQNPKMKIGYKTRYALRILQTSNSLAEIMDAVKSLETSTRLSQLCCVLFTEADAARILLDLIRSCNRSIPHVELVQCILLTLDNVAAYNKLVSSFADCNSAEIFLDKMQMFRDKDGIFCLAVSLLSKIAKSNPMVEEFCAMHEHFKRLKALHGLALKRSNPRQLETRKSKKRPNRMKRREEFDRFQAIKQLGAMVTIFAKVHGTRQAAASNFAGRQPPRFTFDE